MLNTLPCPGKGVNIFHLSADTHSTEEGITVTTVKSDSLHLRRPVYSAACGGVSRMPGLRVIILVVLGYLVLSRDTYAAPETWFEPVQTVTGNATSGFGSALACSAPVSALNHSFIGVGAPEENSGDGKVHIVGPSGIIQSLSPPNAGLSGKFGATVAFVKDINSDGINELFVGEPGGSTGYIHVYTSTGSQVSPYTLCGTHSTGAGYFGSSVAQTNISVFQGVNLLVGTVDSASINSYDVTFSTGCGFVVTGHYSGSGAGGSRWGQSLAELTVGMGNKDFLVGAPRDNSNAGRIYTQPQMGGAAIRYSGTASDQFGVSVAARSDSSFFAFNAPYSSEGGTVHVKGQTMGSYSDRCTVSMPMSDLADTAAQSLAHLNGLFSAFLNVGVGTVGFASYRTEASTGGSVGLFGVSSLGCGTVKQVNNCQSDSGQKQGQTLAGGSECVTSGGTKIIVVGAPGFSNGAGRIDVYAEDSEFGSAVPCAAPTNTPTSTPTPESPPPAESATPTATPAAVIGPIPVDQGTTGLPAPEVVTNKKLVQLVAPVLQSKNPKLQFASYLFTIIQTSSKASRSAEIAAFGIEAFGATQRKKREIISKRNSVTLRNLGVGSYTANYRPIFTFKKGKVTKRVFGKASASRVFKVS
jgi:hypothetical protein